MKPLRLQLILVDVSPAMIAAGVEVLHESGAVESELSSDGLLVRRILDAALAAHECELRSSLRYLSKQRIR